MEKKISYTEFSSQLNEKNIVVLELGRSYTRCGFAGELAPRGIIKTAVQNSRGEDVYIHDILDTDELKICIGKMIEKIYFNQLAVSPKEKKVVVVESVFCRSIFRRILTQVLFDQFNVPSILFVPDHLMALATLGRSTGLVVDLGSEEAISIAVVDGVTLLDGTQFASLGAKTLDSFIYNQLISLDPNLQDKLSPSVLEDIRIRTCFVAPYERGLKMTQNKIKKTKERRAEYPETPLSLNMINEHYVLPDEDTETPATVSYPIDGHKTISVPGNLREGVGEILFEVFGHEHSLTTVIIETILMAPLDCRTSLAENVLIIGGIANIAGLEHRLCSELKNIYKTERFKRKIPDNFKFHRSICPKNCVSWLGASIFSTPLSVELRSTTREQWIKDGKRNFPEWSDLIR